MKFTVLQSLSLPSIGMHLAKIKSVDQTTSGNDLKTPQLKVVFIPVDESQKWIISKWYNLRGYLHSNDSLRDDHVVMKNNKPVESDENTDICLEILGRHANRMGLDIGQVDSDEMINLECGISVEAKENDPSKVEITNVISAQKFEEIQL